MKKPVFTAVLLLYHLLSSSQVPTRADSGWDHNRSCGPVITRLADSVKAAPGVGIRVYNEYLAASLSNLLLEWEVSLNGNIVQKGKVPTLTIGPRRSGVIRLPVRMPVSPGEVLLTVYYRLKKSERTASAGNLMAAEQFRLRAYAGDLSVAPAGDLVFTDEVGSFTISSPATQLNMRFNKQTGWLEHYVVGGHMLLDTPGLRTDPGKDSSHELRLQLFSTSTSSDMATVKADYVLSETAWLLHVSYTVNAKGEMQVEQVLETDSTLLRDTTADRSASRPPPPSGMKWMLPAGFDSVIYDAPGQREDYATSCPFAYTGIYRKLLKEAVTATSIRWWKVVDGQGHGMQITADGSYLVIGILQSNDKGPELNIDLPSPKPGGMPGGYHYIYKVTPK
ncbi:DUF4981 domain-containing protein [Flavitalea sp. BT771]|uniref:beta-galactosidase domain 4-containing protein n=1 Tax=Flavitalea sp. BT771 TaxID=3063329 RepID=UPI0026E1D3CC|nr:beta-galactosidase domain 4-containing protein [Flavitalea sp. BT771]MDO6430950.1 DUF4981 domain-containing protein [Flavitalea sp. BT771]MDV6219857.1 DUF4981 domain-containing protein [Flavitalea sp. BT771]